MQWGNGLSTCFVGQRAKFESSKGFSFSPFGHNVLGCSMKLDMVKLHDLAPSCRKTQKNKPSLAIYGRTNMLFGQGKREIT